MYEVTLLYSVQCTMYTVHCTVYMPTSSLYIHTYIIKHIRMPPYMSYNIYIYVCFLYISCILNAYIHELYKKAFLSSILL